MEPDSNRQLFGTTFAIGAVAVLLVFVILNRRSKALKRLPPGPKPWPIIGNLDELMQMSHEGFATMSKKYGSPVVHVWLGSVHLVVANSVDTAKEILKFQDSKWSSKPRITAFKELAYNNQTLSTLSYGPLWRNIRKVFVVELLTTKRMELFKPVRAEEIKEAVRSLLQDSNGEKAVTVLGKVKEHLTNVLTRMLMSKSYFGKHAGSEASEKFQLSIRALLALLGVFHLGDFIPLFKHCDVQGNKKKMRKAHLLLDDFLQKIVDERRQQLAEKRNSGDAELQEKGDFLDVLLTRKVDGDDVLSDDVIKGVLQDSIIGGVDSSANTVEWALAEILRHPKVLEKLQDELDREVGRERLVEEDDLPKLVYLQATVKEGFRLHPVTPLLMPYESIEACEIAGYHIPAGSQAYVNAWAIGRDPTLWENPLDFNPERFVGNPIDVNGMDFELLPFGSGKRKCPGISMGVLVVEYLLATLLQSCDWSFAPGKTPDTFDMSEGSGIVNHRRYPLEAIITRRLPEHVLAPAVEAAV